MSDDRILTPPTICANADIELAHRQMQRHRACRIEYCAWKWVAYYTLVASGRIAPQALSPRQRAYRRGIAFPLARPEPPCGAAELVSLFEVLDGLTRDGDGRKEEGTEQ
ncbi:hypothetical protein [Nocardia amikacinitolerans]|uniref:hypothetical protein n=1 Tax=Nocardia amikacinitolerans TaxID=756689 RepID=UPI0020A57D51|nr:hypothetical protein [Nocardia amikacinitolerans]MCP2291805.1 hypothetical protein [Nocardia amikacinitolerans]